MVKEYFARHILKTVNWASGGDSAGVRIVGDCGVCASTILVVSNDPSFSSQVQTELQAQDHPVVHADSGGQAIRLIHENRVELVLLDLELPGLSGSQLATILKGESDKIAYVLIVGEGDEAKRADWLERGALGILRKKDFSSDQLQGIVSRNLEELKLQRLSGVEEKSLSDGLNLTMLLRNLPGIAYRHRHDEEWTIEYVSDSVRDLTGYEAADLIQNKKVTFADVIHPDDRERIWTETEEAIAQRKPFHVRYRIIRADGEQRWVLEQGRGTYNENGDVIAIEGYVNDITEHKQIEEKLAESEKQYRELVENLPQKIFHKDVNSVYVSCNRQYADDFEIEANEICGKTDYDFFPRELAEKYQADDRRIMDSGQTEDIEESYILDGKTSVIHTVKKPLTDHNGTVTGILGIFWDITEKKRAEQERRNHLHFLESLDRVNQKIQQADDVDRMLWEVMDTVYSIFGCERAWLMYPIDPAVDTVRIPIEISHPDYPGNFLKGTDLPMTSGTEKMYSTVLASNAPVTFGEGCDHPIYDTDKAEEFSHKSEIILAIYPKTGKPWAVGMHQCSSPRVWTSEERRLFAEIGRRISDALSTLLFLKNLQESEERKELAIAGADLGTWDWDIGTGYVMFDERWASMIGYRLDELEPHISTWKSLVHPDDMPHVAEALRAHHEGKSELYETEFRLHHKSGHWIWVMARGFVTARNPEGKPLRFCGTHLDITDRKNSEEALRQSEGRVRAKLEAILSPEGDIDSLELRDIIDSQAVQVLMDDFSGLTGIAVAILDTKGEILVAKGWQPICTRFHRVHPETCRNCLESDTLLSAGVKPGEYKLYRCKNNMWDVATPIYLGEKHIGNVFMGQFLFSTDEIDYDAFRAQARRYGFDEEEYISALNQVPRWSREDINHVMHFFAGLARLISTLGYSNIKLAHTLAERRLAEDALLSEKLLSEEYINSLPGLFCVFDERRFVRWNRAWNEVTGYSDDELHTRYAADFVVAEDRTRVEETIQRVFREGAAEVEVELMTKDGRCIPYYFTGLRREFSGKPHMIGFGLDNTDRKKNEAERQQLTAQLHQSQKMEAVGQLAGGVAHDFNNILTAILGNVELSMEDVPNEFGDDHPIAQSLEQIKQASLRASSLTRQLLTFSRRDIMQPEVLNLNTILMDLDKMLRRLVTEDVRLKTIAEPDLKSLRADAGQLEQVIVNLVINAVHAMPDGGRLLLETHNITLDEDYVSSHAGSQAGEHVLLVVSDTGHGMDPETLSRIFEPFFTTKPVNKGSGLGLATVYGIVEQSGGHIIVYSTPGLGTTVKVYFPVCKDAAGTRAISHHPDEYPKGSETILLCEDDQSVSHLIAQVLRTAGYHVLSANNGHHGLEIAEKHGDELDLLITDVIMPDMNGRVLCERLHQSLPELPTLFISGYTSNIIAHHGVLDEQFEFLEKPFTRSKLLVKVREILNQHAYSD